MKKYYYYQHKDRKNRWLSIISIFFIIISFIFLIYLFSPFIYWQFHYAPVYASSNIESPLARKLIMDDSMKSSILYNVKQINNNYEDVRNWYPELANEDKNKSVKFYTISIPKIGIESAIVSTTDYELSKHLVHYLGKSLPGDNGTVIIFGHSSLPHFFDSKNYKTIFATLHNLKIDDEFYINVKGVIYNYKIFSIMIKDANDTSEFKYSQDNSYVVLVTCSPPGTTWKRLIIKAKLEKI